MKNILFAVVLLCIAGYLGNTLYQKWQSGDWFNGSEEDPISFKAKKYPVQMLIESQDGRQIEIRLIARNAEYIQFERELDGERFVYPIDQLVAATRRQVLAYPDTGIINAGKHVADGGLDLDEAHIEQLREEISKVDKEIHSLSVKSTTSVSKTERRTIMRQIEDLNAQRLVLENKIAARK